MSGLWWETHAFQNRADQDSRTQHELLVYIPCFTVVCEPEKKPIWRNSSLGLSPLQNVIYKHAQIHCLEKEATLTHGEGVGRRCCPQCELYASGYTDTAAGSIWSAALSLSTPQRLSSRPRDLVSKGVSEHTVSSSSLHPRDLRKRMAGCSHFSRPFKPPPLCSLCHL